MPFLADVRIVGFLVEAGRCSSLGKTRYFFSDVFSLFLPQDALMLLPLFLPVWQEAADVSLRPFQLLSWNRGPAGFLPSGLFFFPKPLFSSISLFFRGRIWFAGFSALAFHTHPPHLSLCQLLDGAFPSGATLFFRFFFSKFRQHWWPICRCCTNFVFCRSFLGLPASFCGLRLSQADFFRE